jgi:hypothetical protein
MAIDIANPGASEPALTAALEDLLPLRVMPLGKALNVDYNSVADNTISIIATSYAVWGLISINNVGGNDNADSSLFTAAGGGGTDLILANTVGTRANNLSVATHVSAQSGRFSVRTESTLYFRVLIAEGSSATGDVYVMGWDLSNL